MLCVTQLYNVKNFSVRFTTTVLGRETQMYYRQSFTEFTSVVFHFFIFFKALFLTSVNFYILETSPRDVALVPKEAVLR